jgi:hypothetical protein
MKEKSRAITRRCDVERKFGITLEHYNEKREGQKNICSICSKQMKRPQLDHCHSTGKIRDFLCVKCNMGLGCFEDNIALIRAAHDYLERHK